MADVLTISVRFALFVDLMLIVGLAAFLLYALGREERRNAGVAAILFRPLAWLCALGLVISLVGIIALTASMQGVGLFAVDHTMLVTMICETDVGAAWVYRMTALAAGFAAATQLAKRPTIAATILMIAGSAALATLIWAGHAGASEGLPGTIHRASDALHMIAAALWLGAIAAFLILLSPRRGGLAPAQMAIAARGLDRFASVGTICVLVVAATGLVNAQMIVGAANLGGSLSVPYGQLLLAKLLLFASMLVLAAANRWRLTPALTVSLADGDPRIAIIAMRRSLLLEAFAAAAILALVAWFGTLEPFPASPTQ